MDLAELGPGVRRALALVLERLAELPAGARLPPLRTLAAQAGVAAPTMHRALAALAREGVIAAVAGSGYYVRPPAHDRLAGLRRGLEAPPGGAIRPVAPWRRVVEDLRADLLDRAFGDDALPPQKILARRYGVSQRTLSRALHHACAAGLLARQGRRYRPVRIRAPRGAYRIVAVVLADSERRLALGGLIGGIVRRLEEQCAEEGLACPLVGYGDFSRGGGRWGLVDATGGDLPELPAGDDVLGYAFVVPVVDEGLAFAWAHLARVDRPVAALDLCGGWSPPAARRGAIRRFLLSSAPDCGRAVGRFLAESGHRRIAWLSPFHQADWSRERLEGLRTGFAELDPANVVRAFTRHGPGNVYQHRLERARAECDPASLARAVAPWLRGIPAPYRRAVHPLFDYEIPFHHLPFAAFRAEVEELFEAALAEEDLTAWVCANDQIAVLAHDVLAERDRTRRIALCGFDNSEAALRKSLTSYRFDEIAAVNRMLAFLRQPGRARDPAPVAIGGRVIPRASTAVAS